MRNTDWSTEQVLTFAVQLADLSGTIRLQAHQIADLRAETDHQSGQIDHLAEMVHEGRLRLQALERSLSRTKSRKSWWADLHTVAPSAWLVLVAVLWLLQATGHGPLAERLAEAASKTMTP